MERPLRVVLDPNVLVSAAITPHGQTGRILDLIDARSIVPILSPMLVSELAGVLQRPRFRRYLDLEIATEFLVELVRRAEVTGDPESSPSVSQDPDDDYLVALGRIASADILVSGDPGVLRLDLPDLPILSPRQLLDALTA